MIELNTEINTIQSLELNTEINTIQSLFIKKTTNSALALSWLKPYRNNRQHDVIEGQRFGFGFSHLTTQFGTYPLMRTLAQVIYTCIQNGLLPSTYL